MAISGMDRGPLRLGLSTGALYPTPTEDVPAIAARLGFYDLEIMLQTAGAYEPEFIDDPRPVVIDVGCLGRTDDEAERVRRVMVEASATSLLVTRPCFIALRRALTLPVRPTGVVLVEEPGRALGRTDVEDVLGAPVVATVAVDAAVARAVDAGLLASRLPTGLGRSLRDVA